MHPRGRPRLSAGTRLALLALAFVAGGDAGRALADRDRPLPRRLAPAPAASPDATAAGLARAVFGVG